MNDFEIITKKILIILLIIFVALEIMEFLLATLTVKLYGGKNSSSFLIRIFMLLLFEFKIEANSSF